MRHASAHAVLLLKILSLLVCLSEIVQDLAQMTPTGEEFCNVMTMGLA